MGLKFRHGLVVAVLCAIARHVEGAPRLEPAECVFVVPAGERASCFYFVVPARRDLAVGPEIALYVAVLHSTAPSPEADPVIFLNGGPGDTGFGDEAGDLWWQDSRLIRVDRDFVLFDQRGVGLARPDLDCPELEDLADRFWRAGLSRAEAVALERPAALDCRDRYLADGIDLAAFSTAESAADVDGLAQALAADSYNLLAVSYGTRVALSVMRRYPERVRSAVLDSLYPPGVAEMTARPWLVARVFRLLFADCTAEPACAAAFPALERRFVDALHRLQIAPETVGAERGRAVRIDDIALIDALYRMFFDPVVLLDLPRMVDAAVRGEFDAVLPWIGPGFIGSPHKSEALALSITCAENLPFADRGELAAAAARAEPYGAGAANTLEWEVCPDWGVPAIPPEEVVAVSSETPTLLLAGSYDPVTPPDYAYLAAATLANGRVVEFRAGSHSLFTTEACADQIIARFIDDPWGALGELCPARSRPPRFSVADQTDPISAAAPDTPTP